MSDARETHLLLYTDRAIRRSLASWRPGRTIFASDEVTAEDRAAYDEVVELPAVADVEGTVLALDRALDRFPADRVFYQTEFGLLPGSILARRRGLPGPTPDAAHLCVNKAACRLAMAAARVPQPRFARCRSAADVRRADLGFPLILKAPASTLGRLVTKVGRDADLDAAVAALLARLPTSPDVARLVGFGRAAGIDLGLDPVREFLAESFATGPTLEADGLVFGRAVDLFGVTEQRVRDGSGFFLEAYLFPADEPGRCADSARRAIEAVGLTDSGFSIEFRGDELIEINGRLGEDDGFPELFRAGLGVSPLEKWLTGDARPRAVTGRHALAYVNRYTPGVVRRIGRVPEGVVVPVVAGQRLHDPLDPAYRAHLAYALASHPTSSRAAFELARARLQGLELDVADAGPVADSVPARGAARADEFRLLLREAWARSDEIFSFLAPDALLERPIALRHPFAFYLGHLPAFAWNQIARGVLRRPSFTPEFDRLFERGIDPSDEAAAARTRRASWPDRAAIEAYRDEVRAAILEAVDDVLALGAGDVLAAKGRVLRLVLEHEWMHHETLLYMVQALDPTKKRPPPDWAATMTPRRTPAPPVHRHSIAAGRVVLGARFDDVDFGWDNEFEAHAVELPAFELDAAPVTNAAFAWFVMEGGYHRRALWNDDAWAWRERTGLHGPLGWSIDGDVWRVRALFGDVAWPVAKDWPASVSHAEATAFARFVGARLPTEAEVVRASESFDVLGNGWEWTSTPFAPHPGFRPWARTHPGYSADFFDGRHFVVLGSSFATDPRLVRRTFRNWFQPHYPYVFSKFRTASAKGSPIS